ncbi:MAG TPA: tRNA (guanosine(37)-N1)-methyltransferase TrmD [Planctomycetaceae bacterium]|nr:tRNA (guanosine(37)-N1)-methyltransferase TrmD [Planctomycetaceae bacterium]
MRFDIITLFPQIFDSFLSESLLAKAIESGLVEVHTHDIRQWTLDKHQKVDDRPFGGGPGMLLQVQPVVDCVQAVRAMTDGPGELILLTPQGTTLRQPMVRQMANCRRLLLLCGRYEGFDQRVIDILKPQEISLGDFILNGGEIAAMAIVESVIRLVPGFMSDQQSCQQESFTDSDLLEFPQYTRPRDFRGYCVPEILLSGNHQQIAAWREQQRLLRTAQRRQDLLSNQDISADSP